MLTSILRVSSISSFLSSHENCRHHASQNETQAGSLARGYHAQHSGVAALVRLDVLLQVVTEVLAGVRRRAHRGEVRKRSSISTCAVGPKDLEFGGRSHVARASERCSATTPREPVRCTAVQRRKRYRTDRRGASGRTQSSKPDGLDRPFAASSRAWNVPACIQDSVHAGEPLRHRHTHRFHGSRAGALQQRLSWWRPPGSHRMGTRRRTPARGH